MQHKSKTPKRRDFVACVSIAYLKQSCLSLPVELQRAGAVMQQHSHTLIMAMTSGSVQGAQLACEQHMHLNTNLIIIGKLGEHGL